MNALFNLEHLAPMLVPSLYFVSKDILSLGGVAQALSRCHHSLAFLNFNLKVLAANASICRSGSNHLPETIKTVDDFSAAVSQAITDSHSRSGNFIEAGLAFGNLLYDAEQKMKRYQRALQGEFSNNILLALLIEIVELIIYFQRPIN